MLRSSLRRSALPVLAAGAILGAAAPAQAATLAVASPCLRYVDSLAGKEFVPVVGNGFSPSTNPSFPNTVNLAYTNGDGAGSANLTATGDIAPGTGVLMPSDFISDSAGWVKTYTLRATDSVNPAITADAPAKFVRVGVVTKPKEVQRNVRRIVRWRLYGAPSGRKIYAHWTFKRTKRATRSLGRAKGPCGIARKRAPLLAARVRFGTWRVYFTVGKRFSRKRALFYAPLEIERTFTSRSATAGAARVP